MIPCNVRTRGKGCYVYAAGGGINCFEGFENSLAEPIKVKIYLHFDKEKAPLGIYLTEIIPSVYEKVTMMLRRHYL